MRQKNKRNKRNKKKITRSVWIYKRNLLNKQTDRLLAFTHVWEKVGRNSKEKIEIVFFAIQSSNNN